MCRTSQITPWSRAEWVEASLPVWQRLVEPVADSVVKAMGSSLPAEAQAVATDVFTPFRPKWIEMFPGAALAIILGM